MSALKSTQFAPDAAQREAIEHVHGPMLVVAGAGTGKTTVLIHRMARLVEQGHAKPKEILALTYTVEAARQMEERAAELVGAEIRSATFHDFCLDIITRAGKKFGVLDEKDLWIYLRKRIHELHLEHYVRAANVPKFLTDLLDFLSRCHDELVTPQKYADYVARLERGELPVPRVAKGKEKDQLSEEEMIARCQEILRVFSTSERWLRGRELRDVQPHDHAGPWVADFGLESFGRGAARARFILVDEFQDANLRRLKFWLRWRGWGGISLRWAIRIRLFTVFAAHRARRFIFFGRHFPASEVSRSGQKSTVYYSDFAKCICGDR